jgi:hypothetical protein
LVLPDRRRLAPNLEPLDVERLEQCVDLFPRQIPVRAQASGRRRVGRRIARPTIESTIRPHTRGNDGEQNGSAKLAFTRSRRPLGLPAPRRDRLEPPTVSADELVKPTDRLRLAVADRSTHPADELGRVPPGACTEVDGEPRLGRRPRAFDERRPGSTPRA